MDNLLLLAWDSHSQTYMVLKLIADDGTIKNYTYKTLRFFAVFISFY